MPYDRILQLVLLLILAAAPPDLAAQAQQPNAHSQKLHALFDAEWERKLDESPETASSLGDLRSNDRWDDVSLAAIQRSHQKDKLALERLRALDLEQLSPADQLNYKLFEREYAFRIEAHQYRWFLIPLNQRGGIQNANSLADSLSFQKPSDFNDWLARMAAVPAYVDQTIQLMQQGVEESIVHSRVIMRRVPRQIQRQIVDNPDSSPYFKPFRTIPDEIDQQQQERFRTRAREIIKTRIVPAYQKLHAFIEETYLPACYPQVGVWQHPQGRDLYAFRTREFTTTDLTPDQVHQLGLDEVARIRKLMESIVREVEFDGSFADFLRFLREDPQFYFQDANQLLAAYQAFCKRVDPKLPSLFKRLPRTRYAIEPIPMQLAPDTTTAYYRRPSADGRRPGTYFVNLYRPEVRPKYEIPALSLHEAVPGHHLQIAFAMELQDLPTFRRYGGYTAYIEGWALYSEKLGEEMELYETPYTRFGQLTYEMWRAVRLVVDTGIHHKRWTREQAIRFFQDNTAKTLLDIENEVDRYIAWPGQALAYKMGELRIRALREQAERALGDRFDIREFHDVVLSQGAVPLNILEEIVQRWIREQQTAPGN